MALVPDCLEWQNAYVRTECLQSAQMGQNLASLYVWIKKSARNSSPTKWFLCQSCYIKIVQKWIIPVYSNIWTQYSCDGIGEVYFRKWRKRTLLSEECTCNLYFSKHYQKWVFLKEMTHFSLILLWSKFENWTLIPPKIGITWLHLFFFS